MLTSLVGEVLLGIVSGAAGVLGRDKLRAANRRNVASCMVLITACGKLSEAAGIWMHILKGVHPCSAQHGTWQGQDSWPFVLKLRRVLASLVQPGSQLRCKRRGNHAEPARRQPCFRHPCELVDGPHSGRRAGCNIGYHHTAWHCHFGRPTHHLGSHGGSGSGEIRGVVPVAQRPL